MTNETTADYRDVLEGLAHSRGFSGAEEVARRAVELDPSFTVRELLEAPPGGFDSALDAVLHMNEEEKVLITRAFSKTFMNPSRLERLGS